MGGRSRRQMPARINIERNISTGFYEGTDGGITYQLTYSQMNALKDYFHLRGSGYEPRIITWFNSLNKAEKSQVTIINSLKLFNLCFFM
jgi:hypothetical protein